MTAKGKITAANLRVGNRVMVTMYDGDHGTVVAPSYTKRKNAHAATVRSITRNPAGSSYEIPYWVGDGEGGYVRGTVRRTRRRSDFDIVVRIDRDVIGNTATLYNVTPSQTFWLA